MIPLPRKSLLKYMVIVLIAFALNVVCFTALIQIFSEIFLHSSTVQRKISFPLRWSLRFAAIIMALAYVLYFLLLLLAGRNDLFGLKIVFGAMAVVAASAVLFWPLYNQMDLTTTVTILILAAFGILIPVFNRMVKNKAGHFG